MPPLTNAILSMTKPRILSLVLVMTTLGFYLGLRHIEVPFAGQFGLLIALLLGTTLTGAGSAILNHYIERDDDGLMDRTHERALVTGIITPPQALALGILSVLGGTAILVWQTNLLTAFLALLTSFIYTLVYTPLKKITWLNTTIGAIPGALPPMGGWVAATGNLDAGAWVLFLILFIWQHPHFYAIAWIYRDQYAKAGFRMLPVVEPSGVRTFRHSIYYCVALIPISLLPSWIGISGPLYLVTTALAGLGFLAVAVMMFHTRTIDAARTMLRASIIYLPLLFIFIIADVSLQAWLT